MKDRQGDTSGKFRTLIAIYLLTLAGFLAFTVFQESRLDMEKDGCAEIIDCEKFKIADVLVDQLKASKKSYANNVWTTLGTIIGAIGLVLGSDKFRKILLSSKSGISAVQIMILFLFILHAIAYVFYQMENIGLMALLYDVVGFNEYYHGYQISALEVSLNLIFDSVLFILLAYVIDRIRATSPEDTTL